MSVPIETAVGETPSAKGSFGFRFMAPLCLGSMLNPVNSTMISTALVAIARDFQATVAETGLLIGGLYITSAIAQPTMGRLADRLGARRVFLAGLYLVALAGVAGTFAPSLRALIWVRVLLGIGTSAAYPTAMRILRNRAPQTGSVEPRMALGILSMSTLHGGGRSGARRNTHRPRWLEDGLHGEPSSGGPRNPARISLDSRRSNKTGWTPKTRQGS